MRVACALLSPRLVAGEPGETDYKSRLQETLQVGGVPPPVYELVRAEGPDHDRVFYVEAVHEGRVLGRGSGGSKLRRARAPRGRGGVSAASIRGRSA